MQNPKIGTARNVLLSWVKAAGLKVEPFEDADVGVQTPTGVKGIKIGQGGNPDVIYVNANDLANPSNRHSVATFEHIMQELGVNYKKFYRGDFSKLDTRTYHGREIEDGGMPELDLTMFRHLEFRVAPNISEQELSNYRNCIEITSRKFWAMNYIRLGRLNIEMDDLRQYARVWTVNFLHRYRRNDHNETCAILVNYLKMRFAEYHKLLVRQETCTHPSSGVIAAHVYSDHMLSIGSGDDEDSYTFQWSEQPDIERFRYLMESKETKIEEISYRVRAKHAKRRLRQKLTEVSHEELVSRLTEATNNSELAIDAQELAQELLAELLPTEGATQEQA